MSIKYTIMLFAACAIWGDAFVRDASAKLVPTGFQKTMADMPMSDRQKIAKIGYEPYLDSKAFYEIQLKEAKELYQQASAQMRYDRQHMPRDEYCQRYPGATGCPTPPETAPATPSPADGELVGQDEFGRNVYANRTITDGPCTMPRADTNFTNNLINSGRWAESDPAFEKATSGTLRVEGGYEEFPEELGGPTKYGISEVHNPRVDVKNLTPDGAQDIMREKYYLQKNINKLPDYVRGTFFDMHFMNPQYAFTSLCARLGVTYQSTITDDIAQKAKEYSGDLNNDLLDDYQEFFNAAAKDEPDGYDLLQGWTNRVNLMRTNGCHYPTEPDKALRRPSS